MQKEHLYQLIIDEYDSMYRFAFTYVKNKDDAMDVVQESICRAIDRSESLQKESAAKSWLMQITANCARDLIRSRQWAQSTEQIPDQEHLDYYSDPDLEQALAQLDDRERLILTLRYFEDVKIADIAQALDMNENTIKSILYRSLKKLKVDLEEGDQTHE